MSKKILNISHVKEHSCQCGSWLNHWEKISGRKQWLCPEVNCDNRAEIGALVIKPDGHDDRLFVLPLCHEHGSQTGREIEVVEAAMLIPAYSGARCGLQATMNSESAYAQGFHLRTPSADKSEDKSSDKQ